MAGLSDLCHTLLCEFIHNLGRCLIQDFKYAGQTIIIINGIVFGLPWSTCNRAADYHNQHLRSIFLTKVHSSAHTLERALEKPIDV